MKRKTTELSQMSKYMKKYLIISKLSALFFNIKYGIINISLFALPYFLRTKIKILTGKRPLYT